MTHPCPRWLPVLLVAVVGCHHNCGTKPPLLSRLRSPAPAVVGPGDTRGVDRFRQTTPANCCDDTLPPPGSSGFGQPVSRGGSFVSPISGMPYSNPLPNGSFAPVPSYPYGTPVQINGNPTTPSYPDGAPIQIGPPSDSTLPPPGSYTIPSPGVPLAPPKSTNDVKGFPPLGSGIVTGDPKK